MNGWLNIVGIGIIGALLVFVERELGFRGVKLISCICIIIIIMMCIQGIRTLSTGISEIARIGGVTDMAANILKIIGVGYVFGISSDISRELGEGGVASVLQTAGRVEILVISLPFVKDIIVTASELLS